MVGTRYFVVALGVVGLFSTAARSAGAQQPGFALDRFDPQASTLSGTTYASPSENVGDLRVGADVRLLGVYGNPFTLATGAQLFVPTGSRADCTGEGAAGIEPRVLAAGEIRPFVHAAKLAFDYRAPSDRFAGSDLGSDFLFGASGSQGFGLTKPIDDNASDEGCRNNRRVEFHIVEPPPGSGAPGK